MLIYWVRVLEYKTASSNQQVLVCFSLDGSHLGSGVTGIDKLPSLKIEMAKTFLSVQFSSWRTHRAEWKCLHNTSKVIFVRILFVSISWTERWNAGCSFSLLFSATSVSGFSFANLTFWGPLNSGECSCFYKFSETTVCGILWKASLMLSLFSKDLNIPVSLF